MEMRYHKSLEDLVEKVKCSTNSNSYTFFHEAKAYKNIRPYKPKCYENVKKITRVKFQA